ncbi:MAG TPA: metal ABC transporter permease [Acidimicrobiales bacterium]|nr:metal ABC transporter permease [Acidimicrobiales bacterium]
MAHVWAEMAVVALVAGVVGFFVVMRGATFAAHTLPQGAFTGAAGASLAGVGTAPGAAAFSILAVLALARWGRRGRHDVVTALVLVMLLATGSLFLSLGSQYANETYSLLFGDPVAATTGDLAPTAAAGAVCIAFCLVMQRRFLLSSLDDELARARGVAPRVTELAFLAVLGAATTLALPIVGALLVFSLMIGPPAAARTLSSRPGMALLLSATFSLLTGWAALAGSYWTNWPIGFFVGVLGAAWYALGRLVSGRSGRRLQARGAGPRAGTGHQTGPRRGPEIWSEHEEPVRVKRLGRHGPRAGVPRSAGVWQP